MHVRKSCKKDLLVSLLGYGMESFFRWTAAPLLNQVLYNWWPHCRYVALSFKILGVDTTLTPKPPVILVPNLMGNKRLWEPIGKMIVHITRRSVVVIDLRNHGDSPYVPSHAYTHQAADILKLIKKLGTQRASLIGHGIGGKTAMCVALMAPDKVAGVLVIDISPVSTPEEYNKQLLNALTAMKAVNFKKPKLVSVARDEAKKQLKETVDDEILMEVILSNIRLRKDDIIGWTCNINVLIDQYKEWASFPNELKRKKYKGPTLFLGGQLSNLIPREDATGISVLFPQAVVFYVPETGHYVHMDDLKTFLVKTIYFLKSHTCDL